MQKYAYVSYQEAQAFATSRFKEHGPACSTMRGRSVPGGAGSAFSKTGGPVLANAGNIFLQSSSLESQWLAIMIYFQPIGATLGYSGLLFFATWLCMSGLTT